MTNLSADHSVHFHESPVQFRLRILRHPGTNQEIINRPRPVPSDPTAVRAALKEARLEGFDAGLREGMHRANASWSQLLREILESTVRGVEQIRHETRQALCDCEVPLLEMAVDLASRIVACEIDAGRYDIGKIVEQAMAGFDPGGSDLTVRVNPQDFDQVAAILDAVQGPVPVRLLSDSEVSRGAVRLESARASLPAEIATRMDVLRKHLVASPLLSLTDAPTGPGSGEADRVH